MLKIYVRVNPRSQISKRHRCAIEFTQTWKELTDIDAATRAALEEDPYLEVSDSPTVLVEVSAITQAGAIESAGSEINNPVKIEANDGSTGDAAQGSDTGTASPADDEAVDEQSIKGAGDVENSDADGAVNDATHSADEAKSSSGSVDPQENQAGQDETGGELSAAEATAELSGSEAAKVAVAEAGVDTRLETIKAAVTVLNPKVAENWLADGRPSVDALSLLTGFKVLAAERDQAWSQINAQSVAG